MYRTIDAALWTDHNGETHRTPSPRLTRLDFKVGLHARLRAFVFRRDGFVCQECGLAAFEVPLNYDGVRTLFVPGAICLEMDHVLSQRNGGTHHPTNLRTLCNSCNARKAGLIDAKHGKGVVRG
jgi:5-methylcytosine-specific restriction endonuclease McrA